MGQPPTATPQRTGRATTNLDCTNVQKASRAIAGLTWRNIVRGTHGLLHVLVLRKMLRKAEIDQLDASRIPRSLHQPVLQLEVAVDNAVVVHVAHLAHKKEGGVSRTEEDHDKGTENR